MVEGLVVFKRSLDEQREAVLNELISFPFLINHKKNWTKGGRNTKKGILLLPLLVQRLKLSIYTGH